MVDKAARGGETVFYTLNKLKIAYFYAILANSVRIAIAYTVLKGCFTV